MDGSLGVFYMRPGNKKRVGGYVVAAAVSDQLSISERNIVDLIAAIAVAVGRNCPGKTFKDYIQGKDSDIIYGKMKIHI